jgi:hypothetical protein
VAVPRGAPQGQESLSGGREQEQEQEREQERERGRRREQGGPEQVWLGRSGHLELAPGVGGLAPELVPRSSRRERAVLRAEAYCVSAVASLPSGLEPVLTLALE